MEQLVWMVLHDGRSIVAGFDGASRELESLLTASEGMFTLRSEGQVKTIETRSVRDFIMFRPRQRVPRSHSIPHLIQL